MGQTADKTRLIVRFASNVKCNRRLNQLATIKLIFASGKQLCLPCAKTIDMKQFYDVLANYYDEFSKNDCDYTRWSQYLFTVAKDSGAKTVVDLACGTGKMTLLLSKLGLSMTGVDVSEQMLSHATQKCRGAKFVCQDVCKLSLTKPQDMAVCVNDGVNYVAPQKLSAFFRAVANNLKSGAPFVFDVSTPYKLQNVLVGNVYYVDEQNATLLWTNDAVGSSAVRLNLTIFEKRSDGTYERRDETHLQYVYDQNALCTALNQSGFEVVEVTADYGLPLSSDSLRMTVFARKL